MKKTILLSMLLVAGATAAQSGSVTATISAPDSGTTCATTNACAVLVLYGNPSTVMVQLSSALGFTGTLQFAVAAPQPAGTALSYSAVACQPESLGPSVTSATAAGVWQCPVAGAAAVWVRASALGSGQLVASIQASTAAMGALGYGSVSGTSGQLAYFNGSNSVTSNAGALEDGSGNVTVNSLVLTTPAASSFFLGTNSGGTVVVNQPFVVNAQTSTYQVLAADFVACKTIPVASGTFTITLVASGSQPASGQCLQVINYGSGVVTIARSGQNINGAASNITLSAGSASAPTSAYIVSDGTNYSATIDEGTVGTVTGTGVSGQCAIWSGTSSINGNTGCTIDGSGNLTANSILLGNGLAGTPALFFQTDHTSGLFAPAVQTVGITTNGINRIEVQLNHVMAASTLNWKWSSTTDPNSGTYDTGFARNAAGVTEINNGTPGTFATLLAADLQGEQNGIATTLTNGLELLNTTAATSGVAVQQSPSLHFGSQVYNTTPTAANNWADGIIVYIPASGASPTAKWSFQTSLSTTSTPSYSEIANLSSSGALTLSKGLAIGAGFAINLGASRSNIIGSADGVTEITNNAQTSGVSLDVTVDSTLTLRNRANNALAAFNSGAITSGTDNSVAGTVTLANSAANAHTIWASGATTTNTIAGFATAPTTGDLVSCTTASTTCTLTDVGFLATNVVRKDTTNTAGTGMTLDMSAATGATAFKAPVIAGATAGADGVVDYDSTAKKTHIRTDGVDSNAVGAVANYAQTGKTAAVTNAINYTPPAVAGRYLLSWTVTVTANTTDSFTAVGTWKNATGGAVSQNLGGFDKNGTSLVAGAITNTIGTGVYYGYAVLDIDNSGTAITLSTAGTFTSVTYNLAATLERIS